MFILKRQDVEISSIQHPKKDQQIPILTYCGQTFRLISVFGAAQEDEARAFWRDLTDNQGKACVLLEEPERYSVWGKIRLDHLSNEPVAAASTAPSTTQNPPSVKVIPLAPGHVRAALLMLQAVSIDIEDLLGNRQATLFEKDLSEMFAKGGFPQSGGAQSVKTLLTIDPLQVMQLPAWQETHLTSLLQNLHHLGKAYFGNNSFVARALESLQDLPSGDRAQFQAWLKQSSVSGLWS